MTKTTKKIDSYALRKEIYMLLFPKVFSIFLFFEAQSKKPTNKSDTDDSNPYLLPKEACAIFTDSFLKLLDSSFVSAIPSKDRINIEYELIADGFYAGFMTKNGFNISEHLNGEMKAHFIKYDIKHDTVLGIIEKKESSDSFLDAREMLLVGIMLETIFGYLAIQILNDPSGKYIEITKLVHKMNKTTFSERLKNHRAELLVPYISNE